MVLLRVMLTLYLYFRWVLMEIPNNKYYIYLIDFDDLHEMYILQYPFEFQWNWFQLCGYESEMYNQQAEVLKENHLLLILNK